MTPPAGTPVEATAGDGPDRGDGHPAAIQVERILMRAVAIFRIGGLAQIAVVVLLATDRFPSLPATLGLITAVAAESTLFVAACARRGTLHRSWTNADVVFCALALVVGAALTAPHDGHSWAHFMYPFTIVTSVGIGLTYRRVSTVVAATLVFAVTYSVSAVWFHHDPVWNVVPNTLSYFPNTIVAWVVARQFRANAKAADDSRIQAVARARELAQERERARHARMLHDRVLQTLETLARSDWLSDHTARSHVAAEAAWLRALVEGTPLDEPADLLTALQTLVQRKAHLGLRIDLNTTQLRDAHHLRRTLPADTTRALVDAAGEALTNVAKHAGVSEATVRVTVTDTDLTVSVLDHGRGFDPDTARRGVGLDQSIRARMRAVGGEAHIDSTTDAGTYVELTVAHSTGIAVTDPTAGK